MSALGIDPSPGVIVLPLSQGRVALIDERDAHLAQFKWTARKNGDFGWYALRGVGPKAKRRIVYLHREVMAAPPGVHVDHVSGDGLDCRRNNLRFATRSQNLCNRGAERGSTSRFKGVNWNVRRKRWRARICVAGTRTELGWFEVEGDAARAYDAAAREAHGAFARLNFPETQP